MSHLIKVAYMILRKLMNVNRNQFRLRLKMRLSVVSLDGQITW